VQLAIGSIVSSRVLIFVNDSSKSPADRMKKWSAPSGERQKEPGLGPETGRDIRRHQLDGGLIG
jgi:hypothetical protein